MPEVTDFSGFCPGLLRNPELREETVRVDRRVVSWFRAHTPEGEDYAARINAALREYVAKAGSGRRRKPQTALLFASHKGSTPCQKC